MTDEDKSRFKILVAARRAISYANFLVVVPRGTSVQQPWFLEALCHIQLKEKKRDSSKIDRKLADYNEII